MRPQANRKITRFFVINPQNDRRRETRFESKEEVIIRVENSGETFPGVASDIGEKGLKLEIMNLIEPGLTVHVVFPKSKENARCFGRAVWARPIINSGNQEIGISVSEWHGIVAGYEAWKKFKGVKPKRERRKKIR